MSFVPGAWNAVCDVCGFEFKSFQLRKRWDGLMCCKEDWELDHPQKYLKVHEDRQTVPWVRKEPSDTFIVVCYPYSRCAYADLGEADCMRADDVSTPYLVLVQLKSGM